MKIRGFELISKEQYQKDFNNLLYYSAFLYDQILLPKRATSKSAGYDVFSPISFELNPNEEIKIPTGIKSYMLNNEVLKAYPRSSLGFKYFLRFANTIPVIDADYYNNINNEGHIWIKLRNESDQRIEINRGEAICQVIFEKYLLADGDSFDGKERIGGLGSTDEGEA